MLNFFCKDNKFASTISCEQFRLRKCGHNYILTDVTIEELHDIWEISATLGELLWNLKIFLT